MRPVLAVQVCLALFQAFLLAPVQHVHETEPNPAGGHEHSVVVHSHFSLHMATPVRNAGPAITDYDGPEAWSLDTFTIVLPMGAHPALPGPAPDIIYAPHEIVGVAIPVEERAHDPPRRRSSTPRAPPA